MMGRSEIYHPLRTSYSPNFQDRAFDKNLLIFQPHILNTGLQTLQSAHRIALGIR